MKHFNFVLLATLLAISTFGITACGKAVPPTPVPAATSVAAVQANVEAAGHPLDADERARANANAKGYFEQEFPVVVNGSITKERGSFISCRPSDSVPVNGLVTCTGLVPQAAGGFKEQTRFCGYIPTLVGCSDVNK